MEIRVLRAEDIRQLMPVATCIDVMERTMIAVSKGQAELPLRTMLRMPEHVGNMGHMMGYIGDPEAYGVKLASLFPRNVGTQYSSHMGLVILFETNHGCPVAMMDGGEITAIRTAAASGFATRHLARADAASLAILGTGEQAVVHLEAMLAVRPITDVRIWGRTQTHAAAFAKEQGAKHGVNITVASDVPSAVDGADLICTVSGATDPILKGAWVGAGTHLNVVGSSFATKAEIDTDLVAAARYFVDYRPSTLKEAGEYLRAVEEGRIDETHILGEIGQVADGACPGRTDDQEITIYKSLGNAAQDIASAHFLLEKAREAGIGQIVTM